MNILAIKARLYVDLIDEYDNMLMDCLHPEFEAVLKRFLIQLCQREDFELKEREYPIFLMALLYRLFDESGVFEAREIARTTFLQWAHTTKGTMVKWSEQLSTWGITAESARVVRSDRERPALDFAAYTEHVRREIDHYDENYEAIELLREMMDLPQGNDAKSVEQVTLMSILERYPETEAGYSGVMTEVEALLEEQQKHLAHQIELSQLDSDFDIWYHWPARGYLRLLFDLVDFHKAIGYLDLALYYGDMLLAVLRHDQLGARDLLIPTAIQLRDDERLERMMSQFEEDDSAAMHYNRALRALQDKHPKADQLLKKALASNAHIPDYLFGIRSMPFEGDLLPDRFSPGDETEAVLYCYNAGDAWHAVPGALAALKKARKLQHQETKVVAFRPRR